MRDGSSSKQQLTTIYLDESYLISECLDLMQHKTELTEYVFFESF